MHDKTCHTTKIVMWGSPVDYFMSMEANVFPPHASFFLQFTSGATLRADHSNARFSSKPAGGLSNVRAACIRVLQTPTHLPLHIVDVAVTCAGRPNTDNTQNQIARASIGWWQQVPR